METLVRAAQSDQPDQLEVLDRSAPLVIRDLPDPLDLGDQQVQRLTLQRERPDYLDRLDHLGHQDQLDQVAWQDLQVLQA